ncbi:uncharacterized protein LOC142996580 [Genypterus blacodes]|uniref:uncharacterized protein LOC142996580 n=1 Tax=Genypterus blacodes TaxID=154954 RepID=UPI003F76C524
MNPHSNTESHRHDPGSPGSLPSPHPYSIRGLHIHSHNSSVSGSLRSPPAIHADATPPCQTPDLFSLSAPVLVPSPFPEVDTSRTTVPNPYPALAALRCQVSIIVPSPDLHLAPVPAGYPEEPSPDLECSICFSQFNNVFRCPKMLQCKHTFCLECLARINVKSAEPKAIQCPLCRGTTPLPALGLPKLATDSDVVSYLPAAMQRVYSIRFQRSKGKLQVKRSSEGQRRWGRQSLSRSLDVGLPSPPAGGVRRSSGEEAGVGGALFRLTGQPACRAFLLTSVVMMLVLLTGILIFLLIFQNDQN